MAQGIRIKEARKESGLSQEALGKKVGVTKSAVSQWENELTTPTRENILAIADLTGFSFRWLIKGLGERKGANAVMTADHSAYLAQCSDDEIKDILQQAVARLTKTP